MMNTNVRFQGRTKADLVVRGQTSVYLFQGRALDIRPYYSYITILGPIYMLDPRPKME
jgi:hypothetical protein